MNKKISALIVDDEPLARDYIRALLKSDDEIEIVGEAGDGQSAFEMIASKNPELVFLDIQMPETDGFTMLRMLDPKRRPAIIFTTAFEDYAIRAFEFHALDYLLKPFDTERFQKAVRFAKERLASGTEQAQEEIQITEMLRDIDERPRFLERLLIKLNGRIVFLKTSEIEVIRADDKYVQLHAGKSVQLVRQSLAAMSRQLDPGVFVQVHRSVIINVERIRELQTMFSGELVVVMESGAEIPLSRNYKNRLFEVIGNPL